MTVLYIIRHGETLLNRENRFQGAIDYPLTERGLQQALCIAEILRREKLAAIYSSPALRAVTTAEAIAKPHGLDVITDSRLSEMNHGEMEGLSLEDLERRYPGFLHKWMERPADMRIPGGETLREVQQRAWRAVEEMAARHRDSTIALVSHNLTIITILCRAAGTSLDEFRSFRQSVACINIISFSHGMTPKIIKVNDTSHLSEDAI